MKKHINKGISKVFTRKEWTANRADPTAVESYSGRFRVLNISLEVEVLGCWGSQVEIDLFWYEHVCFAKSNLHFGKSLITKKFINTKFSDWLLDLLDDAYLQEVDYPDYSMQM